MLMPFKVDGVQHIMHIDLPVAPDPMICMPGYRGDGALPFRPEGVAKAVTRPTMQFVELKSQEQLDTQTLHRSRDRLVGGRP
jgi:hypothetical protein